MSDVAGKIVPAENEIIGRVTDQDSNKLTGKLNIPGLINYGTVHTPEMLYNTVSGWNEQTLLKSKLKTIYVYTDYSVDGDGNPVAGYKIGDGNAYLIDLPFYSTVSLGEKQFWNSKVSVYVDPLNPENLVFTTN